MPVPLMSKEEVVQLLYETFRRNGYDSASLGELSKETGLGKSSLYHYFPGGKEEMALSVLDLIDRSMETDLFQPLREKGDPQARFDRVMDGVTKVYANGRKACLLGTLSTGLARHQFQDRLQKTFQTWVGAFEKILVEVGIPKLRAKVRAEDAVLRIQGSLILAAGLDDPKPFQRVIADLREHFLSEDDSSDGNPRRRSRET